MYRVYVQGEDQRKDGLMIWNRTEQLITELSSTAWCELAMFLIRSALLFKILPPATSSIGDKAVYDGLIDYQSVLSGLYICLPF